MTLDELESSWSTLVPPTYPGGVSGRRAIGLPPEKAVYLAVDSHGHRHLFVQLPEDTPPVSQHETRSLEVVTARFQVGSNPEALYVDLACIDPSQHPTFCAVAQDLLRSLRSDKGSLRDSVVNALARWRTFWTSKPPSLSREEALGLFGELWFMRRWLGPINATIIDRWQVTDAARHDFQWPEISIEVKATAARHDAEPIHKISSLEQLAEPQRGQLLLFSLHVTDDALSSNTLHALVEGIAGDLGSNFAALTALKDKLAIRGYSATDRQAACRPLRILSESLYSVGEGFPRITTKTFEPTGLPSGVLEISYSIDLAACKKWLVGKNPTDHGVRKLLQNHQ